MVGVVGAVTVKSKKRNLIVIKVFKIIMLIPRLQKKMFSIITIIKPQHKFPQINSDSNNSINKSQIIQMGAIFYLGYNRLL